MRATSSAVFAVVTLIGLGHESSAQGSVGQPRAQIVQDLRLDADAEDFPASLRVFVSPTSDRRMFIPLATDATIRVYDSTGMKVGTIGRRGEGPGEFGRGAIYLGWKRDTLWVDDGGQRRISYFGRDLQLIRTTSYPRFDYKVKRGPTGAESRTIVNLSPLAFALDGSIIGQAFPAREASKDLWDSELLLVHYPPKGTPQFLGVLPPSLDSRWIVSASGYGHVVPFAPVPFVRASASGDRIAHVTSTLAGDSGIVTLTMLKSNGDTVYVRRIPFAGAPVMQMERDSALFAIKPREGPPDLAQRFFALSKDRMPKIHPPVEYLVLGLDNTAWIGLNTLPAGRTILVVSGKGNLIGTVQLPPRSTLRQATLNKLWTTRTNDDGLMSVVRYEVQGLRCASGECD